MTEKQSTTLQALLRFALPVGTSLVTGSPDTEINWAVTVRAQPPAFPEIHGGELALVSMDVLRVYDSRMTVAYVVSSLSEVGVAAMAVDVLVPQEAIRMANEREVALLLLPDGSGLARIERDVNKAILNQSSQLAERALEIQRQLTRLAAENRDLNSLLQLMARVASKSLVIHDDAGVLIAQAYPSTAGRRGGGRSVVQNMPYREFQRWLEQEAPNAQGMIVPSPIGFTTVLKVEKRVAGYLSWVVQEDSIDEFDRLVLTYGADVCAIELAKTRAIASAVEQARGDWIQMWLSGAADDEALMRRAQQSGFDPQSDYIVAVFRAITDKGQPLPQEALLSLVRDDLSRRQIEAAVGQYVETIVVLYPLDSQAALSRLRTLIEELRQQLALRTPSGLTAAGISRPGQGLGALRDAYREARNAINIAQGLGEVETTTFYGDLKLYQLLLELKDTNQLHLSEFYEETLGALAEQDERKQSDLLRTLSGFFDANGNLAQAAKDLDVHRNTLVYRLEKISELTGLDLNDADNRLILHLALKVKRVLATVPGHSGA